MATLIGLTILRQIPTTAEAIGIAFIVCAVALHRPAAGG
jgi:hypothetical protein